MSIVVRIIPLVLLYLAVVTDGAPCCMACSPCCCGCGGGGGGSEVSDSGSCGYYSGQSMESSRYENLDNFMRAAKAPAKGKGKAAGKAPKPKGAAKPAKGAAKPAKGAAKPAKGAAKPAKGAAKPPKAAAVGGAKPAGGADGVLETRYTSTPEEMAARQMDPPPNAPPKDPSTVKQEAPVYWND